MMIVGKDAMFSAASILRDGLRVRYITIMRVLLSHVFFQKSGALQYLDTLLDADMRYPGLICIPQKHD